MDNNYKVNINISKLRADVQSREDKKYKTFETILESCYQKILNTNKTSNTYSCLFICPQVVFGLPLYNIGECINFIMIKLIEKGFDVHLALPNHIYISWKPKTTNQPQLEYPQILSTPKPITYHPSKLFNNKSEPKHYRPITDYHIPTITSESSLDDILNTL